MTYQPLYAEKRCLVCGYWRGEHIGASENDVEMKCPIDPSISEYLGVTTSFIPSATITYTIHCRDRRYCANAAITITATDQDAAHMAARNQGWLIHTANDLVTCPACQTGRHPRKDQL